MESQREFLLLFTQLFVGNHFLEGLIDSRLNDPDVQQLSSPPVLVACIENPQLDSDRIKDSQNMSSSDVCLLELRFIIPPLRSVCEVIQSKSQLGDENGNGVLIERKISNQFYDEMQTHG